MRTTRWYFLCCTRRVTSTTMVFSIFALVTLPVSLVLSPRLGSTAFCVSGVIFCALCLLQFVRAKKCLHARQIFFRFAQPLERFGLPGGHLKTQPENLLGKILVLCFELIGTGFANFF